MVWFSLDIPRARILESEVQNEITIRKKITIRKLD